MVHDAKNSPRHFVEVAEVYTIFTDIPRPDVAVFYHTNRNYRI